MNRRVVSIELLREKTRTAVLTALDECARELTGPAAHGWADVDLPYLFPAIDAHLDRVVARFSDPESTEPESAIVRFV